MTVKVPAPVIKLYNAYTHQLVTKRWVFLTSIIGIVEILRFPIMSFFLNIAMPSLTLTEFFNAHMMGIIMSGVVAYIVGEFFWLMNNKLLQLNKKLQVAQDEVVKASRAKDIFLASVSHELRTPLYAICALGQLINEKTSPEKLSSYIAGINSSALHLETLINDVLEYSKLESSDPATHIIDMDHAELMDDMDKIISPIASKKGLEWRTVSKYDNPYRGNYPCIKQVLINLVSNAVKHTTAGSVTLECSMVNNGGQLQAVYAISDTGPGFDEEKLPILLQPFVKDSDNEGVGLGLSIVKKLIDIMHGEIQVKSDAGGTTFTVHFPVHHSNKTTSPSKTQPHVPIKNRRLNIIVVDDNETARYVLKEVLSTHNHFVSCADGRDALFRELNNDTDIIIMDLRMPDVSGLELATEIREQGISIPILLLTADTMESGLELSSLPVDAIYIKPINNDRLVKAIDELVFSSANQTISTYYSGILSENVTSSIKKIMSPDKIKRLLKLFRHTSQTDTDSLIAVLRQGDYETARALAHRLKSSSLSIGASSLSRLLDGHKINSTLNINDFEQTLKKELTTSQAELQRILL